MRLKLWLLGGCLAVSACMASGPLSNPVASNLTWFSYAAGTDLRAACTGAGPDTYRFIYNGIWQRQLRQYDLAVPAAGPAELRAGARGRSGNVAAFSLNDPFGPWRLATVETLVDATRYRPLLTALEADTAAAPVAAGQRLNSNEFYWLVAACRGGVFSLAAFNDRRVKHTGLRFPEILLRLDTTGVPFVPARRVEGLDEDAFQLRVNSTGDGLVGVN